LTIVSTGLFSAFVENCLFSHIDTGDRRLSDLNDESNC